MKKKFKEVYILILSLFILNLGILSVKSLFNDKISQGNLILFGILAILLGVSLVFDLIFSMIFSSFVVLIYSIFLMYMVYTKQITGIEQISYYMWFIVFPIGSFIGGSIRKKLNEIGDEIKNIEALKDELALKDSNTLFKNKSSFFLNLSKGIEIYHRKKIMFSAVIIEIQDFQILKDTLKESQMAIFYKHLSKTIDSITRFEDDKYFLDNGQFSIILDYSDEVELAGALQRLREQLKKALDNPVEELRIKKIPFKLAGVTVNSQISNPMDMINRLNKGIELDV
ncbi:MAG: diguanylate cyclase [Leptotrichiaceae bacterium]|nr:diguanylate cyclase [Leptotrichiaceae bacterium]MBP9630531.1 diguanylate cyclase [Leptotrichiaceae bacterium]